jgi:hypothetical protein
LKGVVSCELSDGDTANLYIAGGAGTLDSECGTGSGEDVGFNARCRAENNTAWFTGQTTTSNSHTIYRKDKSVGSTNSQTKRYIR